MKKIFFVLALSCAVCSMNCDAKKSTLPRKATKKKIVKPVQTTKLPTRSIDLSGEQVEQTLDLLTKAIDIAEKKTEAVKQAVEQPGEQVVISEEIQQNFHEQIRDEPTRAIKTPAKESKKSVKQVEFSANSHREKHAQAIDLIVDALVDAGYEEDQRQEIIAHAFMRPCHIETSPRKTALIYAGLIALGAALPFGIRAFIDAIDELF